VPEPRFDQHVAAIRRFNRFYTQRIGVLQEGLLESPYSLTEVRVLYELAHRERPTATELSRDLGLDQGYLSRILRSFRKRRLIDRTPSDADGRQTLLSLSARGRRAIAPLEKRSREEVGAMLHGLTAAQQAQLIRAMRTIEDMLGADRARQAEPYLLRAHRPGDMGWVVSRHGAIYAEEYGWTEQFEALVASIVAKFIEHYDPQREHCWIAERDGENVGCIFLVRKSATIGQLRLLLVEPCARGLGIGHRLVAECIRFARQAGYRKVMLWTNDLLHAARRLYQHAGFRLVKEERHHSFGHDLIGQTWVLDL
jgi:DNA-binding MarR family transcriptional regulator/N-acetylglutamate synthase-like GNAT family acetyltransferase